MENSGAGVVFLDELGRLALPKIVQEEAGLHPGMALRVSLRHGRIEIEPVESPVRLVKKGRLTVAVLDEPAETLSSEAVRQTQRSLRDREPEG